MKILNLKTNKIFDLPKDEASRLLKEFPQEFIKNSKRKKMIKSENNIINEDSILLRILE